MTHLARILAILAVGVGILGPARIEGSPLGTRQDVVAPSPSPSCGSLQAMVDAATPGSTVHVPDCIFRESIRISKPLTLVGPAEIRGTDIWSEWAGRRSSGIVPPLPTYGPCRPSSSRCSQAEQVFVDGVAQVRVEGTPQPGRFAIDAGRHVILGTDPAGHVVEVTTRPTWVSVEASDVTIEGFTMRGAGNPPQAENAALRVKGVDRFTLRDSRLLEAHGALIGLRDGTGHRILDSELADGGQEGFGIGGTSAVLISGVHIHGNNTEGFDPSWEAGGGKAGGGTTGLTIEHSEVDHNDGVGLWCDIGCKDATFADDLIHDNTRSGIAFEISSGATIAGNRIWENGWGFPDWGWGGGIVVSSSGGADVHDNVVAWNADGITIVSQGRADRAPTVDDRIHSNVVVGVRPPDGGGDPMLLGWIQDWSGTLFAPTSGNAGDGNRFFSPDPEPESGRFAWDGDRDTLAAFAATPGGAGSTYLGADEAEAILRQAGIPTSSTGHASPAFDLFGPGAGRRLRSLVPLATGIAILLLLASAGLVGLRRRRSARARR